MDKMLVQWSENILIKLIAWIYYSFIDFVYA